MDTVELDNLRVELNDRIDRIPTRDVDVLRSRVDELQAQLNGKVDNTTFDSALASKVDNIVFRPAGLAAGKGQQVGG